MLRSLLRFLFVLGVTLAGAVLGAFLTAIWPGSEPEYFGPHDAEVVRPIATFFVIGGLLGFFIALSIDVPRSPSPDAD